MRSPSNDEAGMSLVEMTLAMGLMVVIIVTVLGSMTLLTKNTSALSRTTVASNSLQQAEQALVQDVHSAADQGSASTPWCTAPTGTELKFTMYLHGASTAVDFKLTASSGGYILTLATSTGCTGTWGTASTLLINLDNASEFTEVGCSTISVSCLAPQAATWTGETTDAHTYYDGIGLVLTVDSPSPTSSQKVQVTESDPTVMAWNVEDQCQESWAVDPQAGGTDPC